VPHHLQSPANHNSSCACNLSNCRQEIRRTRLFLSDNDDLVFCRTGSAKPLIDFILPMLRGSCCTPFSVLHQHFAQRYITRFISPSHRASYHTSFCLSHSTYPIRGAGSASGIIGSTSPSTFAHRHGTTIAKVYTRTSLPPSYSLTHCLYTI